MNTYQLNIKWYDSFKKEWEYSTTTVNAVSVEEAEIALDTLYQESVDYDIESVIKLS